MRESDNTEVSNSFPLVPLQEPLLFSFSPRDSPDSFPAVSNFAGSLKIHSLGYACSPYTDEETYSSQSLIKEMGQEEGFLPPPTALTPNATGIPRCPLQPRCGTGHCLCIQVSQDTL